MDRELSELLSATVIDAHLKAEGAQLILLVVAEGGTTAEGAERVPPSA